MIVTSNIFYDQLTPTSSSALPYVLCLFSFHFHSTFFLVVQNVAPFKYQFEITRTTTFKALHEYANKMARQLVCLAILLLVRRAHPDSLSSPSILLLPLK
jgi:hypothetical protein